MERLSTDSSLLFFLPQTLCRNLICSEDLPNLPSQAWISTKFFRLQLTPLMVNMQLLARELPLSLIPKRKGEARHPSFPFPCPPLPGATMGPFFTATCHPPNLLTLHTCCFAVLKPCCDHGHKGQSSLWAIAEISGFLSPPSLNLHIPWTSQFPISPYSRSMFTCTSAQEK